MDQSLRLMNASYIKSTRYGYSSLKQTREREKDQRTQLGKKPRQRRKLKL